MQKGRPGLYGIRCHVKNQLSPSPNGPSRPRWEYEELALNDVRNTNNLLIRIMIGKIINAKNLLQTLRSVPVVQGDPEWRCRSWCADALVALERDGQAMGASVLDWRRIEELTRRHVREKIAQGRFDDSWLLVNPKPTWDLWENKEVIA